MLMTVSRAADPIVRDIEDAFVAYWSLLGQWPGAQVVDEDGVLRYETPIRKLPYNGVIRTTVAGDTEKVVAHVTAAYAGRGADFFWLVHPSATPADLTMHLTAAGLTPVEAAIGMSLDLGAWRGPEDLLPSRVDLGEVVDEGGLRAYADMVMAYWELDEDDRPQITDLNRYWSGERAKGRRWLAFLEGRPVGKAYLSLVGPPGVAAIYGMSVRPEARGHGIAGSLTQAMLVQAQALGCRRVVLHSTEMAAGIYRRAGFTERCPLTFFATAPIWSGRL
jgi:ribosomal protein S18 acetylase RimI-like enzyme